MLEDVTTMLAQACLPASFWGRCLATQVKVWNCLPTASLPGKTPFEAWWGRKPDLSRFRVFGCMAYVFVQKDKHKKLESHMQKCIFVGYPPWDCGRGVSEVWQSSRAMGKGIELEDAGCG